MYDLIIKFIEESDPQKYKIENLKELKEILESANKNTEEILVKKVKSRRRKNEIWWLH